MKQKIIDNFLEIIDEEMGVAQGCTEPIAGAYCGAIARDILDAEIDRIVITASKNIIKNARGVIIPKTKDLMGIKTSVAIGIIGGDASKEMEVLVDITEQNVIDTKALMDKDIIELKVSDSSAKLHMKVELFSGDNSSSCEIMHTHTNIVETTHNGETIISNPTNEEDINDNLVTKEYLNIKNIYEFANEVKLDKLDIVKKQKEYNSEISKNGLTTPWGIQVGLSNLEETEEMHLELDVRRKACATASSGSDARMNGCPLPVVTLNGSGNQGICACMPIITYGEYLESSEEKILRAMVFADLVAIRLKLGVGRLSPLCGATLAAIGAVSGIMYLYDNDLEMIGKMIKNSIANNTGVICDGAKGSCALKIYTGVDAAILSAQLADRGNVVPDGIGIVKEDLEETIDALAEISDAMDDVDDAIMHILYGIEK
ncbi:MAG: serine dehydratase subunit alpha family protein [Mycoplasmatales bacterium]